MASRRQTSHRVVTLKHRFEYLGLRGLLLLLASLPRNVSRSFAAGITTRLAGRLHGVRRSAVRNLQIAFPHMTDNERSALLDRMFAHLGSTVAEFAQMRSYSPDFVQTSLLRYEGLSYYDDAMRQGRGVLVLTGHLGAWELSSFAHSLLGRPMGMVIRRLDNPLVDAWVNKVRCMHGNRVLHKDDFARELLRAMQRGEAVGILMDTNMTPPQGVFVPFFGQAACTGSGLARVARKTGAAVIPGFLFWHDDEKRYVLKFGEPLTLQLTGDAEDDAVANTALFARVTEQYIREYPDQWLWLHRRWKTRPAGEGSLY